MKPPTEEARLLPEIFATALDAAILELWIKHHKGGLAEKVVSTSVAMFSDSPPFSQTLQAVHLPHELPAASENGNGRGRSPVSKTDPHNAAWWRTEVLRFATEHDWMFVNEDYRKVYDPSRHNGLVFSRTRCPSVIGNLCLKKFLAPIKGKPGQYRVTDLGRQEAMKSAGLQGVTPIIDGDVDPVTPEEYASTKRQTLPDVRTAPVREILLHYAAANETFKAGAFTKWLRGQGRAVGNSTVSSIVTALTKSGGLERINPGVLRLGKRVAPPPTPPPPALDDTQAPEGESLKDAVLRYGNQNNGVIVTAAFEQLLRESGQAIPHSTLFTRLKAMVNEGVLKYVRPGLYHVRKRVSKGQKRAPSMPIPKGGWRETFLEIADRFGGAFTWPDVKLYLKVDRMPDNIYPAMHSMIKAGYFRKTAQGGFAVTAKVRAAHA